MGREEVSVVGAGGCWRAPGRLVTRVREEKIPNFFFFCLPHLRETESARFPMLPVGAMHRAAALPLAAGVVGCNDE